MYIAKGLTVYKSCIVWKHLITKVKAALKIRYVISIRAMIYSL